MPVSSTNLVPALLMGIFGWRLVVRMRRNLGRQLFRPTRLLVSVLIYTAFVFLLGTASLFLTKKPGGFSGLLAGVILGGGLGAYALQLTQFEKTDLGKFYTPNRYIGLALSILLAMRLAYRVFALTGTVPRTNATPPPLTSALTLIIFGTLAGYYIVYFTGVRRRLLAPI